MSDASVALALPETITWKDQVYTVGPISLEVETLFCQTLLDRAIQLAARKRGLLGDTGYREMLAGIGRDEASFQYEWGGSVVLTALYTPVGYRTLFWFATRFNHPGLARATIEEICNDPEKWEEVQVKINKLLAPPNPTPPAAPGAPSA
jgi:hypothetical protein